MKKGKNMRFFCCWSGGKDSCLALYRARAQGYIPVALFSFVGEDGLASRSHGLPLEVLHAQSCCLGLGLEVVPLSRDGAAGALETMAERAAKKGCRLGVFGDIFVKEHREWIEEVADRSGFRPLFPLWGGSTSWLVREFLAAGFRALVVSVKKGLPQEGFLGAELDESLISALENMGVDPCGENGEYHTLVYDGPLFLEPLRLSVGRVVETEKDFRLQIAVP